MADTGSIGGEFNDKRRVCENGDVQLGLLATRLDHRRARLSDARGRTAGTFYSFSNACQMQS